MIQFPIAFEKFSGTGNDFVIIDNRSSAISASEQAFVAERVCRRKFSVGADGLIFIEKSQEVDFSWRFYNADGSIAEMCGNGSRCAARFAFRHGIADRRMKFSTLAGVIEAEVGEDESVVRVKMTDPHSYRDNLTVKLGEGEYSVDFLDTGVPHAVIFIENETIPVDVWGREVRFHDLFKPKGTNVNFVEVGTEKRIKVRTYERGVEAETMACGTGAVASALITALHHGLQSPIEVITSGGEVLTIFFKMAEKQTVSDVYLQGATHLIYSGSLTSEALL